MLFTMSIKLVVILFIILEGVLEFINRARPNVKADKLRKKILLKV